MTTSHLISIAGIAMSLLAGSGHHEGSANARAEEPQRPDASGNYATVNGLRMYYETRGEGEPLVTPTHSGCDHRDQDSRENQPQRVPGEPDQADEDRHRGEVARDRIG